MKKGFASDIAASAKKDPAYAKMAGPEPDEDDKPSGSEAKKQARYLGQAFDAAKKGDRAAFVEALTAWRTDCAPMK